MKAILFDCDGTLVDSEYAHYLGWKHALQALGGDLVLDDYYQYVGKSAQTNAALLAATIGKECADLILQLKRAYYVGLCKQGLPPIGHTVQFLKELITNKSSLGLKLGVCSTARKMEILAHLKHLGVLEDLDVVLSGQEDLGEYSDPEGVNKPKPYIYLHAMKQLGVTPDRCIVIEDSAPGVAAGVAAGCYTIAVPNDYTCTQDLSLAHLRMESFSNLDIHQFLK